MLSAQEKTAIINSIHSIPQYQSCMIGLYDELGSELLHSGKKGTPGFAKFIVIVEVQSKEDLSASAPETDMVEIDQDSIRSSKAKEELMQAGVSCGFALLSGMAIVGSSAGSTVTGGASIVIAVSMWGGFVTSASQCGNGIFRTLMVHNGSIEQLKEIDENPTYAMLTDIVDGWDKAFGYMSLAGGLGKVLGLKQGLKKLLPATFSTLPKSKRKVAVFNALKKIYDSPGGEKKVIEALKEAGQTESMIAKTLKGLRSGGPTIWKYASVQKNVLRLESEALSKEILKNWKAIGDSSVLLSLSYAQDGTKYLQKENEKFINVNVIGIEK